MRDLAVGSTSSKAPEGRQLIARGASPWKTSQQTGKPRRGDRKRIWQDASRARDAARRIQSSVTPSELNDGEGPAIQGLAPLAIDCRPCGPDRSFFRRRRRLAKAGRSIADNHGLNALGRAATMRTVSRLTATTWPTRRTMYWGSSRRLGSLLMPLRLSVFSRY